MDYLVCGCLTEEIEVDLIGIVALQLQHFLPVLAVVATPLAYESVYICIASNGFHNRVYYCPHTLNNTNIPNHAASAFVIE